jgi:hypothetical protein
VVECDPSAGAGTFEGTRFLSFRPLTKAPIQVLLPVRARAAQPRTAARQRPTCRDASAELLVLPPPSPRPPPALPPPSPRPCPALPPQTTGLVDFELLTVEEAEWLDDYHRAVREVSG